MAQTETVQDVVGGQLRPHTSFPNGSFLQNRSQYPMDLPPQIGGSYPMDLPPKIGVSYPMDLAQKIEVSKKKGQDFQMMALQEVQNG